MSKLKPKIKIPNQRKLTDFAVKTSILMIEAGRLGLFKTQRDLHNAVRCLGWEIDYLMTRKAKK